MATTTTTIIITVATIITTTGYKNDNMLSDNSWWWEEFKFTTFFIPVSSHYLNWTVVSQSSSLEMTQQQSCMIDL